jgi:superfamily II DNA helicase RecQ
VGFRSIEQEQALYAVLDKQTPLVVVLPMGGGKSLLFALPALIKGTGVTVVIVPYKALIVDLVGRLRGYGVDCIEWTRGESNPASVVIVSANRSGDDISNGNFLGYAQLLKGKGLLQQVVVDECYLVLTAQSWRDKMLLVKNLRMLGCPTVLLTATLPLLREAELEASMMARNATFIWASTVRPNARYFVSWCKREAVESIALAIGRRWVARLRRTGEKGVVYCRSKPQSERMAEALGCMHYYAEVEEEEQAARLQL